MRTAVDFFFFFRFFGDSFVGGGCFRTCSFCAGIYNLCSFNELVWMLHALVRKRHVLGFFFFVGLFTTSSFSTLPVLASSAVVSLFV